MGSNLLLASYPKSGNTWVRIFLVNLFANAREPLPLAEIGRLAAEHLLNLLGPEKETARLPDRPVGVTLVDMGTTGPPPEAVARAVSDPHEKAC